MVSLLLLAFMLVQWALMAFAFWEMRRAYLTYRGRWRSAVEVIEQVQVENERLVSERDEAVMLSQEFHKLAQKAEGLTNVTDEETRAQRERLMKTLNEHVQRARTEQDAKIEKTRARLMAKRETRASHYGYNTMPSGLESQYVREYTRALREMYRR